MPVPPLYLPYPLPSEFAMPFETFLPPCVLLPFPNPITCVPVDTVWSLPLPFCAMCIIATPHVRIPCYHRHPSLVVCPLYLCSFFPTLPPTPFPTCYPSLPHTHAPIAVCSYFPTLPTGLHSYSFMYSSCGRDWGEVPVLGCPREVGGGGGGVPVCCSAPLNITLLPLTTYLLPPFILPCHRPQCAPSLPTLPPALPTGGCRSGSALPRWVILPTILPVVTYLPCPIFEFDIYYMHFLFSTNALYSFVFPPVIHHRFPAHTVLRSCLFGSDSLTYTCLPPPLLLPLHVTPCIVASALFPCAFYLLPLLLAATLLQILLPSLLLLYLGCAFLQFVYCACLPRCPTFLPSFPPVSCTPWTPFPSPA